MKLREFAEVTKDFWASDMYVITEIDENGCAQPHLFYPNCERKAVENLFDYDVKRIEVIGGSFIAIDVYRSADSVITTASNFVSDMRDECDEFLNYLESFKR